ncbi:MAG: beta-lactamase family protein [Chitinophagales bacterium]|nr:beta-lactamase family protein [Chitinophagales bacterium]MDW8418243.1 serine hydrolase [Chitinophagales bacterium]
MLNKILKLFLILIVSIALLIGVAYVTGNGYLLKGLWAAYLHGNTSASIDDMRFFTLHDIPAGNGAAWPLAEDYNRQPLSDKLLSALQQNETVAFLIIHNDSILAEHYWHSYSDSSLSNSFSMAKSIVTLLAQIAIQKGYFQGWNQKVVSVLPELQGEYARDLELWHLSAMCAGLDWDERYHDPFSITAKAYYGNNLQALTLGLRVVEKPGQFHNYQSGATQLLGICLTRVTGKTLSELASAWLWQPLQAQHTARWHTDGNGTELAFCCFNSNARDFARFGKLMLHHGRWNNTQLIDSAFVSLATSPVLVPFYGYSFWLHQKNGVKVFYQWGILGQFIITIPSHRLVIVRLGRYCPPVPNDGQHSKLFLTIVEEVISWIERRSKYSAVP